jgi:putative transposase
MATTNRLWGAERIRGELLKLEIRMRKRTIQKYMKQIHPKRARGQTWRTFLRNHAAEVWACDFLQVKVCAIAVLGGLHHDSQRAA